MYFQIRFIYNNYFKSYVPEMMTYIQENDLEFVGYDYPTKKNWDNSPFKKSKGITFNFFQFEVNGLPVFSDNKKYLILVANDNSNQKEFWLEIKTSFFHKPKLVFKENTNAKVVANDLFGKAKYIEVLETCPACGFKLETSDMFCPDCELKF